MPISDNNETESIFDIVIPFGPNDDDILTTNIEYNCKNIIGYRYIYIIAYDIEKACSLITVDKETRSKIHVIPEQKAPFSVKECHGILGCTNKREGWYFQQLLKLCADQYIKDLCEYWLVIDTDTVFLKPTTFFESGLPLYNFGSEYNAPYFTHISKLMQLDKQVKKSGICHHMMFCKTLMQELRNKVEKDSTDPFWRVFLMAVDPKYTNFSGASEYELYFNYLHKYHPNAFKVRSLVFRNISRRNMNRLHGMAKNIDYVSLHHYL